MNTNLVVLSGYIIKTPELKTSPNGNKYTTFCVSNKSYKKDNNGEYESELFECVAWKGIAEYITKYAQKGTKVTLNGRLENIKYISKDGSNRKMTQINVAEIDFITLERRNKIKKKNGENN